MFVRVNAIFNTWSVILHEGRIGGLNFLHKTLLINVNNYQATLIKTSENLTQSVKSYQYGT